jgi:hypothetical protein
MCHILLTWNFWTEQSFFNSVVAVTCLAVPLTLKAAEFSVSTLQRGQHCYTLRQHIYSTSVLHNIFLQQNLKVLVRFFHVNCISQWDRREIISIAQKHCLHTDLRWINTQRCVQVAILPWILGCYFSALYPPLLNNMSLCLTAYSYKVILLHLSHEDPRA